MVQKDYGHAFENWPLLAFCPTSASNAAAMVTRDLVRGLGFCFERSDQWSGMHEPPPPKIERDRVIGTTARALEQ